jgi:hypothetical protein
MDADQDALERIDQRLERVDNAVACLHSDLVDLRGRGDQRQWPQDRRRLGQRLALPPVELPEAGAYVRLEVDSRGYIRELEILSQSAAASPALLSDKNDRITTRLAVLGAAAIFCGHYATVHPDVRSEHFLLLAERWLAWVDGVAASQH